MQCIQISPQVMMVSQKDFTWHLIQCLNYSFQEGEMSSSQKQAVITLIEKKDRDKRYIKNWRPISLLNVDAEILSKVLATRIKRVIHKLISNEQSAYVLGRHITDAIRSVSDLLYYADQNNLYGYLVSVDMEKAFDSVDHTFIISTLRKYGFGPNFTQWIKVLLNKHVRHLQMMQLTWFVIWTLLKSFLDYMMNLSNFQL